MHIFNTAYSFLYKAQAAPVGASCASSSWDELAQLAPTEKVGKGFATNWGGDNFASPLLVHRFEPINILKVGGWTPLCV